MKQDEIIEMARQAGMRLDKHNGGFVDASELKRFAKLIEERAAAKERDAFVELIKSYGPTLANGFMLIEAIRARSEA